MLNRLQAVFKSFHSHDVRYIIIGGIAAILHGVPRATFDLDILIEPDQDNAQRLIDALMEAGFGTAGLTTAEKILANEITILKDKVRIDIQTQTPGIDFQQAWERKKTYSYQGQTLYVLSKKDLISSKKASGRSIDLEDVRLLELCE